MSNTLQRRYPYEPLARLVACRMGLPYCPGYSGCVGCTSKAHAGLAAVADYLGVSPSAPLRWVAEGGIPERTADLVVLRIDLHPILIDGWREIWLAGIEEDADDGKCRHIDEDDPWLMQESLFDERVPAA